MGMKQKVDELGARLKYAEKQLMKLEMIVAMLMDKNKKTKS